MNTETYVKHCYISQQNIQFKKLLMITVGKYAENKKMRGYFASDDL